MKPRLILLLGALALASCSECLTPHGEIVEREMTLFSDASHIEVSDGIRIVFSDEVPAGQAIVRTHDNVQPYVEARTDGDRILFGIDARRFRNLDVTITTSPVPYSRFTASGGSEMRMPQQVSLREVTFVVSGGSKALFTCECDEAMIDCSGGSEIACTGRCDRSVINCSGGSRLYGYDFPARVSEVVVSGGSRLEVTVTESLTGENSGGSVIFCKGNPNILNINNSGGSTTERL